MFELPPGDEPSRREHAAGQSDVAPAEERHAAGVSGQESSGASGPDEGPQAKRRADAGAIAASRRTRQTGAMGLGPGRRAHETTAVARGVREEVPRMDREGGRVAGVILT